MIFLLLSPFFILIFVVLLPAVWSLAIYGALLIFRSRLRYINETKAKKLLIFGSIATLFIIWELEVPQQVIFNNLTKHSTARYMYDIEIVDDNYTLPVDYKRFGVGYAEPYYDCVHYFYKCPLLPMPHQFKHYVDENRNGKKSYDSKVIWSLLWKNFF